MMIFEESDLLSANLDESEFGVFFSFGITLKSINLNIYSKVKTVFSAPENIPFYSFGIKLGVL